MRPIESREEAEEAMARFDRTGLIAIWTVIAFLVALVVSSGCGTAEEWEAEATARRKEASAKVWRACVSTCPEGTAPAILPSGAAGYPACACLPPGTIAR